MAAESDALGQTRAFASEPDFNVAHLRAQALPPVLGTMVAAALGLILLAAARAEPVEPALISVIAGLILVAGLSYVLAERRPLAARAMAVAGLLLGALTAVAEWPGMQTAPWIALTIPLAASLLGWRWASALAIVAVGATLFLTRGGELPLDIVGPGLALLPIGCLIVYWLVARPLRTALDWAWTSYLRAERLTEEARDRQAVLARLTKSLNTTCYQLELTNHELERARQAAEEAHQIKAEFAAAISHELRTPLNLIIGFSEMMVMAPDTYVDEVLPEGYRGDVQAIYRSACHLSSLVDDVLDLAEVEAHRMALDKEWVPLSRVVGEAVTTVATLFEDRELSLSIDLPQDLPALYIDRTRIRQVLINLLTNAARFTSTGGAAVRARSEAGDVVVEVADTGTGIPPEEVPSLFKHFHRSAGSTPGPYGGRGLGLIICRRFVEMHGGAMRVESSAGQGSTFSFTLPLCETVVVASAREEWQTWARPTGNTEPLVAVVAPDDARANLFQRYLGGYHVVRVGAPIELRALAESGGLSAVVLAGPDADEEMKRRAQAFDLGRVPIIACPLQTNGDDGLGGRVARYLVKPISREQLRQALASVGRRITHVAVVDDDPEMVRLLTRMLRSLSRQYRIVAATDGVEALRLFEKRKPDVVLLDLLMPGVDGYAVVDRMHEDPALVDVPVIVASAWGAEQRRVTATGLAISLPGGLALGEAMRYLEVLLRPPHNGGPNRRAAPAA